MISISLRDHLNGMSEERRSYTLQMLAQHLYQASQYNRLHGLIVHDWMLLRLENDGNYSGFLKDINIALESTYQAEHPPVRLQIRYALMQSSINSLAANIPPILFPLFLESGIWNFDEAMNFALQITDLEKRCEALLRLGQVAHLSETQKRTAFIEALNVEWAYKSEQQQEILLRTVSSILPKEMFSTALHMAQNLDDAALRQSALSALALQAPNQEEQQALFAEALALARSFESPDRRAEALANLAPMLTTDLIKELLTAIEASDSTYVQAQCLQMIAGYLPPQLHSRIITYIRSNLSDYEDLPIRVLVALVAQKTLKQYTFLQPYGFQPLPNLTVPMLPREVKRREKNLALFLMRKHIKDALEQARMLCILVEIQPDLQKEALETALLHGRQNQIGEMDQLTRHLTPELQDKVIDVFTEFSDERDQRDIIKGLAPLLNHTQLIRLLEITEAMSELQLRLEAMGLLIQFLPENQHIAWIKKAYRLALFIGDKSRRESTISKLIKHQGTLPTGSSSPPTVITGAQRLLLRRIITTDLSKHHFMYDWGFIRDLESVFPVLDEKQKAELVDVWINDPGWDKHRFVAYILGKMASSIPGSLLVRIFDYILSSPLQNFHSEDILPYLCTLADIAYGLPYSSLSQIITSLDSISHPSFRSSAYVAMTPFFESVDMACDSSLSFYDQALDRARAISNEWWRRWTFLSLLPYVPAKYVDEALTESWGTLLSLPSMGFSTQYALLRLCPFLPIELFEKVINILDNAANIQEVRPVILSILSTRLIDAPAEIQNSTWKKLLQKLARRERTGFLKDLPVFAPFIVKKENQEVMGDTIKDILEISTWWP